MPTWKASRLRRTAWQYPGTVMALLDHLARVSAIAVLALLAVVLLRDLPRSVAAWTGSGFFITIASYLWLSSPDHVAWPGLDLLLQGFALAAPAAFCRSANVRTIDPHRSHGWRRPVWLARHAARPAGILGWLLAHVMAKETAAANAVTMTLAEIGGGDHVLDVGCGPGVAVATIARRLTTGRIVGLDPSGTMIGLATRANRAAIAQGTAVIEQGDAARLPHAASSFDRILSTHTMYFWADLERVAQELRRVLKPGGRLVLGFGAPEHMRHDFPSSVYSLRSADEVCQALRRAGFDDIRVETRTLGHRPMHWMIAT